MTRNIKNIHGQVMASQLHLRCKLHFKCLPCTKIVIFMLQTKTFRANFSGTSDFLKKNFTGFLNSLVLTTCVKVGRF